MLLFRSPSLIFAFLFSILSILLTTLTFQIAHHHSQYYIQFLIILPPLNSILLFLFTLTWVERRFRLSYIPFLCLIILFLSSLTLTIISSLFFSIQSYIIYLNLIFHSVSTIVFFLIIFILIFFYFYGVCSVYYNRYFPASELQSSIDQFHFRSNENELFVYSCALSNERICHDIQTILHDFNEIHIGTILSLNESREYKVRHPPKTNRCNLDNYSLNLKRANIKHIIYPIREHFIPKSISDYMQFLYTIILNITRYNHNQLFVHSMKCFGRNSTTIVCLDLVYEYLLTNTENKQTFCERVFHYPFSFPSSCRVCRSIGNIRKIRTNTQLNPLQIYFLHEFYARLKSSAYMEQIRNIININEKLLLDTFDDLQLPINI